MRIKHQEGAAALVHKGKTYEADEDGFIDAPTELAELLLNQHVWDAEEVRPYVPAEVEEEPASPALLEAQQTPADELTPYQKGLLTRAANEAKAAEAK